MRYLTEINCRQKKAGFFLTAAMAALVTHAPIVNADVCSEGTGIPPFLSSSVDPNMLLVIDNSGSMLDMAYIDSNSQCFDETFDTAKTYAGYFSATTWYKWTENPGSIDPWANGACHADGDIVYGEGAFYKATCETLTCDTDLTDTDTSNNGCTANREYLSQLPTATLTPNIHWHSLTAPKWLSSLDFTTGDFVTYDKQVYKAQSAISSTDSPPNPSIDKTTWKPVKYTWDSNGAYSSGDIVSYNGMLYKALKSVSANSAFNDILDEGDYSNPTWQRLDEGYFEEVDMSSDSCSGPSYSLANLEITLKSAGSQVSGSAIATNPIDEISCFRTTGNLLNWASSSKFDIQKKILTGGKYYAGYEEETSNVIDNNITSDTGDDRIIQESRGCAGKSFAKQISLDATNDIQLTLRIRGSDGKDQVDTTDDRTRIEIFAVTAGGYDDYYCQQALDLLQVGVTASDKNDLQDYVTGCMYGTDTNDWPSIPSEKQVLERSIMDCWQISLTHAPSASGTLATHCQKIYEGSDSQIPLQYPWAITEWDPFYMCYGEYDPSGLTKGEGFFGRCWAESPSTNSPACNIVTCTNDTSNPIAALNAAAGSKEQYKCSGNEAYQCLKSNCKDTDWDKYSEDSTGTQCTSGATSGTRVCDDWQGDSVIREPSCWTEWQHTPDGDDPIYIAEPVTPHEWKSNSGGGTDTCFEYAEYDYCQGLQIPEVIDPSDQVFATGETYNVPASLIDTGLFTQLNVEKPLLSMSGYLKYTLPLIQNSSVTAGDIIDRPDGPRGIVYDIADSLRLGVMAFHDNGSKSEIDLCVENTQGEYDLCDTAHASYDAGYCAICSDRDGTVIKYNPDDNADGAKVLVNVANGMYTDAVDPDDLTDDVEVWDHYLNVVTAINNTKARSWTPLAEALYNALGYYGQDSSRRLQTSDFHTTGDFNTWVPKTDYIAGAIVEYNSEYYQTAAGGKSSTTAPPGDTGVKWSRVEIDPVQYWCQDNHILIITEGASTADINADVKALAESNVGDNDGSEAICTNGLEGSTYLDDLTYFGQHATVQGTGDDSSNLYTKLIETGKATPKYAKQAISTHIVTTGSLRTDGTGECSPYTLMTNAATNGGTGLYSGEDPAKLESHLIQALNDILNRASAGSAASVISSSKSGEGAAYQAVFWPKTVRIPRETGDYQPPLSWIGDVHSMYVDTHGGLWDDYSGGTASAENTTGRRWSEDTNGNGRLDANEDLTGGAANCLDGDRRMFFYYDSLGTTKGTKVCFNDSVAPGPWKDKTNYEAKRVITYKGKIYKTNSGGTSDGTSPLDDTGVTDWAVITDLKCETSLTKYCGTFTEPVEIREFDEYLWSANDTLAAIDDANITINREVSAGKWVFNLTSPKRYIFTWNDLDNDGIVDSNGLFGATVSAENDEIIELDNAITDWAAKNDTHHSIFADFRVDSAEMPELVNWLRGDDSYWETDDGNGILELAEDINGNGIRDYVYRCRRYPNCNVVSDVNDPSARTAPVSSENPVWRMGDIIHSTPKLVAQPSEGFQTIYRDATYSSFIKKYRFRRHVIYFGANDGMLHAVNGGFFDEDKHQFFTNQVKSSGELERNNNTGPALGHELWAYIPYNLQPHLSCMTDPDYVHKYYVDHEPRIFDVQIWDEETACATDIDAAGCIHPKGWGTILVGSMRFGGTPIDASGDSNWNSVDSNGDPKEDNREFVSSYFILDITDPEGPPTLLGEMTVTSEETTFAGNNFNFTDLGYTTPMPTMVFMREADSSAPDTVMPKSLWYLIMGKGPTSLKGENNVTGKQQGKLGILPLSRLTDNNGIGRSAFRLIDAPPSTPSSAYTGVAGVAGDTIAIPGGTSLTIPSATPSFTGDLITVDMDIEQSINSKFGAMYKSDAVFFGTVDGATFATPDSVNYPDRTIWPGNGNFWRLVTKDLSVTTNTVSTPADWGLKKMITSLGPITAAPTIGWDGDNVWLYVGTGRFFADEDKTDNRNQYYYGIKEPRDSDCSMNWATVDWLDSSGKPNTVTSSPSGSGGSHGLLRTDNVKVIFRDFYGYSSSGDGVFFCDPNSSLHGKSEPGGTPSTCDMSALTALDMTGESLSVTGTSTFYRYDDLIDYIAGETRTGFDSCPDSDTSKGIDGWYRIFHDDRERNIGQATLLGGLLTFTTYQPSDNPCTPEGVSYLYGLHYQTGSAWYQNIFGLDTDSYDTTTVNDRFDLGKGLSTTPSIHVGDTGDHDAKAFVQTSTGEIVEITQEDLPIKPPQSGKQGWNDSCQ